MSSSWNSHGDGDYILLFSPASRSEFVVPLNDETSIDALSLFISHLEFSNFIFVLHLFRILGLYYLRSTMEISVRVEANAHVAVHST